MTGRLPTSSRALSALLMVLALSLWTHTACDGQGDGDGDSDADVDGDGDIDGDGAADGDSDADGDGDSDGDGDGDGDADADEDVDPDAGWTDPLSLIVPSDGTRSLGDPSLPFNDTRDQGSKIVFFDAASGDNATAGVYWWNGSALVDSEGNTDNPDNGEAYGTDPLEPNEAAIRPFADLSEPSDPRLTTQAGDPGDRRWRYAGLAGAYPDWYLFRRGQEHTEFGRALRGGRSEAEPMVVAAYGPPADGRAIFGEGALGGHNWGEPRSWLHQAVFSIEIRFALGYLNLHTAETHAPGGGPVTAFFEDVYFPGRDSGHITYPPAKTTFRRCIITNSYRADAHNQGYYTAAFDNQVRLEESILYRNGYKDDPVTDPDPRRDIFSRNIYQGGGAQMGHTYSNIISADGGSGGPQMRLGGLMENSLVIEGYWFSATSSNDNVNEWLRDGGQVGQSAHVRNNVQLVYAYPSPNDPDTHGVSDTRAHPGWGYALSGASFGAVIEGNIVSGAMLADELGGEALYGLQMGFGIEDYEADGVFRPLDNIFRDNIVYRVRDAMRLGGDATGAAGVRFENNVFAGQSILRDDASGLSSADQLLIDDNRFYAGGELPSAAWFGAGNTLAPEANAASSEGWSDPDRTLRRYVVEVLGLTLLDWDDDPFLDADEVRLRVDAGEAYDPIGLKTFMAVATNMRRGGVDPIPSSGTPSWTGDYPWDERYTGLVVVNWIRAGFGMPAVP